MIVVGVTGSFASGKSEVVRFLKRKGASVFDADRAAKKVVREGTPVYRALVKLFGKQFVDKHGRLDRRKLAEYVFRRPSELTKLNTLVHPAVIFEILKLIRQRERKKGILVLDVPLLFESKMQALADVTVLVTADQKLITKRAGTKGIGADLARRILRAQWPVSRKKKLADFVIENNGTLKNLEKKVNKIYQTILN